MKKNFDPKNPIYNLVDSGARGNWWNVTQLCGMKGLVVSPTGKTIELPIKSNLKEGFSTLEYFIATHGGRKGKADTALKTAQSGYLTRRLVDAAQNILVREFDCGTIYSEEFIVMKGSHSLVIPLKNKIYGKFTAKDVFDEKSKLVIPEWTLITKEILKTVLESGAQKVSVRSVLTCETEEGVCQKVLWARSGNQWLLEKSVLQLVSSLLSQSVNQVRNWRWEHFTRDEWRKKVEISRLVFLELKNSSRHAIQSIFLKFLHSMEKLSLLNLKEILFILNLRPWTDEPKENTTIQMKSTVAAIVAKGDTVEAKQIVAKSKETKQKVQCTPPRTCNQGNREHDCYRRSHSREDYRMILQLVEVFSFSEGDMVKIGSKLTEGHINIQSLMDKAGVLPTELYIVGDIKENLLISRTNSKCETYRAHCSTDVLKNPYYQCRRFDILPWRYRGYHPIPQREPWTCKNSDTKRQSGTRLLLGLTKISLFTESWLSAASFQETVRVLVDASTSRKVDHLDGLKENVIIGRLIPTLNYFENNRDVGEFFAHASDGNETFDTYDELEITTASTSLV
jgi:DNA-directed RNA polymerase subunit beta'